jgi:uncharacterized surface protein with fasciclin (FAS1) repeats
MIQVLVLAQIITANSSRNLQQQTQSSIAELTLETPELGTLAYVLTLPAYAGIFDTLSGPGPFTVFAPTDAAFGAIFASGIDVSDVKRITAVLQYHFVRGSISFSSSALVPLQSLVTLQGESLLIAKSAAGIVVNSKANVTITALKALNGVVHLVDSVLFPPSFMVPASAVTGLASAVDKSAVRIGDTISADRELSTFAFILDQSAYSSVLKLLSGPGPLTVFAPTDAAFATAFASTGIDISDVARITAVLKYHVLPGLVLFSDMGSSQSLATLQGESLLVTKTADGAFVNGYAEVVAADVIASNGVVHVVDVLLMPPSYLAPMSVAPTVAPTVCPTAAPSFSPTVLTIAPTPAPSFSPTLFEETIAGLALANPALSTLVYVLTQPAYAGILKNLSGPGPLTLFAPTDAAFATAFASTGIDVSDVKTITAVLQYHILAGTVLSSALALPEYVATLQGESVLITKSNSGISVNSNAKVEFLDVIASNGVMHVVDSVLSPPSLSPPTPAVEPIAPLSLEPSIAPVTNVSPVAAVATIASVATVTVAPIATVAPVEASIGPVGSVTAPSIAPTADSFVPAAPEIPTFAQSSSQQQQQFQLQQQQQLQPPVEASIGPVGSVTAPSIAPTADSFVPATPEIPTFAQSSFQQQQQFQLQQQQQLQLQQQQQQQLQQQQFSNPFLYPQAGSSQFLYPQAGSSQFTQPQRFAPQAYANQAFTSQQPGNAAAQPPTNVAPRVARPDFSNQFQESRQSVGMVTPPLDLGGNWQARFQSVMNNQGGSAAVGR